MYLLLFFSLVSCNNAKNEYIASMDEILTRIKKKQMQITLGAMDGGDLSVDIFLYPLLADRNKIEKTIAIINDIVSE